MTTIYVGNLPFSATEADVRAPVRKHGAVQSVKLVNDRETGRPRGFGFVEMSDERCANRDSAHEWLRHGRPPAASQRSSRTRGPSAAAERPLVEPAADGRRPCAPPREGAHCPLWPRPRPGSGNTRVTSPSFMRGARGIALECGARVPLPACSLSSPPPVAASEGG